VHALDSLAPRARGQQSSHNYWKEAAMHDLGAKLVIFFFMLVLVLLVSLTSETQLTPV